MGMNWASVLREKYFPPMCCSQVVLGVCLSVCLSMCRGSNALSDSGLETSAFWCGINTILLHTSTFPKLCIASSLDLERRHRSSPASLESLGKLRANILNAAEWTFFQTVSVHIQSYILCILECIQYNP